jgi:hypothetical protein
MIPRKGFCLFFVFFCLSLSASAYTVSFLVIETGLPEAGSVQEASGLWENSLLAAFFDAGHIVSNAPILRLPRPPGEGFPEAAREDFEEAIAGGAEFFVLALLDYRDTRDDAVLKPRQISLRAFNTRSGQMVYQGNHSVRTGIPAAEEQSDINSAIRALISRLR